MALSRTTHGLKLTNILHQSSEIAESGIPSKHGFLKFVCRQRQIRPGRCEVGHKQVGGKKLSISKDDVITEASFKLIDIQICLHSVKTTDSPPLT